MLRNLGLIFLYCLYSNITLSQDFRFKPVDENQRTNSNIIAGLTGVYNDTLIFTESYKYNDLKGSASLPSNLKFKSVQDFITLGINHDTNLIVPAYKYAVTLQILKYIPASGSPGFTINSSQTIVLQISYDPDSLDAYNDLNVFKFSDIYAFNVVVKDIQDISGTPTTVPRNQLAKNFFIDTRVSIQAYDKKNIYIYPSATTSGNNLLISWTASETTSGATCPTISSDFIQPIEYELEWTYIDNYSYTVSTGTPGSTFTSGDNITYDFRKNATRVRLKESNYKIPLIYERGAIVYRVRAIRPDEVSYKDLLYYDWTLTDAGTVNLSHNCKAYYINTPHNSQLNWQYSINFAEEGKYKHVINYFDGSLKSRQTQTKINTDNDYIVAVEKMYDFEGNKSMETLPVPVVQSDLGFRTDIALNSSNGDMYEPANIDSASCGLPTQFPALDTLSMAYKYYSSSNPDKSGVQKFVPDAKGYPVMQSIYSPDKMLLWQGGAGADHQLWTKHATRYEYTRANEGELMQFFGNEVGPPNFYPKVVTTDPNEQTSFTISNGNGQPIATGLIGSPNTSVTPLELIPTDDTGWTSCANILGAGAQQRLPNGKGINTNFYVEKNAQHKLQYRGTLNGWHNSCTGKTLWARGYYDYGTSDECGVEQIPSRTGYIGYDSITTGLLTSTLNFSMPVDSYFISKGKYYVAKQLTFNRYEIRSLIDSFIRANEPTCFKDMQWYVKESVEAGNFPCVDINGDIGPCDLKKRQMIQEMWPGAKYGQYERNEQGSFRFENDSCNGEFHNNHVPCHPWAGIPNANSIFTAVAYGEHWCPPHYETPWHDPVMTRYQDACISYPYTVYKNGIAYSEINKLPIDTFIYIFNDEIAEALLPLHPEYCKLKLCDDGGYITQLESYQTFRQAELGNRFELDSIIKYDPLYINADPTDKPSIKRALSSLTNLSDKKLNKIAIERAYCAAGNAGEVAHCAKYVYGTEIQNDIFINNTVKQDYYNALQELYLLNRAMVLQIMMDSAVSTCTPCSTRRMTLIQPPVFPTVFDANGGFDTSLHVPGWIDTMFRNARDPLYDHSTSQSPSALTDSFNRIKRQLDTARAEAIMGSLINCSRLQANLDDIRNALLDTMSSGAFIESPEVVDWAISEAGVALTDLCNGYLPSLKAFNTTNDIEYKYDCEIPALYQGLKDFLSNADVINAIKNATMSGSSTYTVTINSGNQFETKIAEQVSVTLSPSGSVSVKGYVDTIHASGATVIEYVKLQISGPSLSTNLYLYNKAASDPKIHGTPSITLTVNDAYCTNDDKLESLSSGLIGKNTAIVEFNRIEGANPPQDIVFYTWSKDISFMNQSQGTLPINCITCIDIKNAFAGFNATYDTGNINRFNHPNSEKHLTNYLNYNLNTKYNYNDYIKLMRACALSDSIEFKKYLATIKITCSTKALADTFAVRLKTYSPRHLTDFRYQHSTGNSIFGINLTMAPEDSLQVYKYDVIRVATDNSCTATYLPEDSLRVFIKAGCTPSPAINTFGNFYTTSVTSYQSNGVGISGTLYTYDDVYASAFAHAQLIADMNAAVEQCSGSYVLSDAELLRNEQYGTTESGDYLEYVYSLDGRTRYEIRDSIDVPGLEAKNIFPGKELMYDDPYCSKSVRDLYIFDNAQGAHPGSVRLETILNNVKSRLTSTKLFLPDGTLSDGTGGTWIFRKVNGVHWYRYFDGSNNLYNVHLQPPANPPYSINTLKLDSLDIGPGTDSIYRFTAYMHYNDIPGEVVKCKGYTDFPLGYGQRLESVVLYNKIGLDFCLDSIDCEYNLLQEAIQDGKLRYQYVFDSTVNAYTEEMFNYVIDNARDTLLLCGANQKNMITLYYYDLNGNLRKTVPPAGVNPSPYNHTKKTIYEYDSRNLLIKQETPDGGLTTFYYDGAGRLVFSQNDRQKPGEMFSYTLYDKLSRPTETGTVNLPNVSGVPPVFVTQAYKDWLYPMDSLKKYIKTRNRFEVVITTYDTMRKNLGTISGEHLSEQENLINRVSSIAYYQSKSSDYIPTNNPQPEFETFYSYDPLGNVKTVTYDCIAMKQSKQQYKRVDYDYDQLSGKVNMISYNRSRPDQFYQHYRYDADNRITMAETSNDGIIWNKDATYEYYKHGPVANVKIGNQQIQSIDYAYTIQGWLKAINGDVLRYDKAMMPDGAPGNPTYARDVIAHAINYFNGDYQAIDNTTTVTNFAAPAKSLYNGNIVRTNTAIMGMDNQRGTYRYDQAHRILGATYETVDESTLTVNTPSSLYKNSYEYDYDGNLKKLVRYDGTATRIDSMLYSYRNNTNRLAYVDDKVTTTGGEDFQPGQTDTNYFYDELGNLVADSQAHLRMTWTHYGKLNRVERTNTSPVHKTYYYYDGLGNRVRKMNGRSVPGTGEVFDGDYYVRDAGGNILATYRIKNTMSKVLIIDASNSGNHSNTSFPTFINSIAAGIGNYVTAFTTKAITDMPTWVATQTDKPISFYLDNGGLYSQIMTGGIAADYLNDLQDYSVNNLGYELFSTAMLNHIGATQTNLEQVLMYSTEGQRVLRHFDEQMPQSELDEMWGNLGVGSTRTPSAHIANANTLYNWMTMNGTQPDVVSAMMSMIDYNVSNSEGTESRNFLNTWMHDDVIFESTNLRSEPPAGPTMFEENTREILYTGGNMGDILGFFDQWGTPATDWLTTNTTEQFRMETVYMNDADNVLSDWLGTVGDPTELDDVLAAVDEIGGFDYLTARTTAPWIDVFGPVNQTSLYVDAIVADTTDLAEHHIYGSSRLGTQWYPTGSMRQIYNISGGTVMNKLSDPTVWYSHAYKDLIKKDQKEPWGQRHQDTMRVSRTLGYRQYEMTDHLGNVLATVLDRKTGVDTGNGAVNYAWYHPDLATSQDYYPFGMRMTHRHNEINDTIYRFGYNGQEKDNGVYGAFNKYDFAYRAYNPQIGKFFSVDPLAKTYPWNSTYAFAENRVIDGIDLEGKEYLDANESRVEFSNGHLKIKVKNLHFTSQNIIAYQNRHPEFWNGTIGVNLSIAEISLTKSAASVLDMTSILEMPKNLKQPDKYESDYYTKYNTSFNRRGLTGPVKGKQVSTRLFIIDIVGKGLAQYVSWHNTKDAELIEKHKEIAFKVITDFNTMMEKGWIDKKFENQQSIDNVLNMILFGDDNGDLDARQIGRYIYNQQKDVKYE